MPQSSFSDRPNVLAPAWWARDDVRDILNLHNDVRGKLVRPRQGQTPPECSGICPSLHGYAQVSGRNGGQFTYADAPARQVRIHRGHAPPAREVLTQSRTLKGTGAAGVATVGAAGMEIAQEVITDAQGAVEPLVPHLDTLRVFIALALTGAAVGGIKTYRLSGNCCGAHKLRRT
jgi:hypothetical protein